MVTEGDHPLDDDEEEEATFDNEDDDDVTLKSKRAAHNGHSSSFIRLGKSGPAKSSSFLRFGRSSSFIRFGRSNNNNNNNNNNLQEDGLYKLPYREEASEEEAIGGLHPGLSKIYELLRPLKQQASRRAQSSFIRFGKRSFGGEEDDAGVDDEDAAGEVSQEDSNDAVDTGFDKRSGNGMSSFIRRVSKGIWGL
jgi:hypothetical protein